MEGAKSERLKQRWRKDKRNWFEEKAAAAEKAAENGRNRELYNMTKAIVGERKRQRVGVRNKHGELKTQVREKLQRWVEHFSEILNRDDPTNPVEEYSREDLGRWGVQEVKDALKNTRQGKQKGRWSGSRPTKSWHRRHSR